MANKFGKFLLFTAAVGTAAAATYYFTQKKAPALSALQDDDDDYDDFSEDLDEDTDEESFLSFATSINVGLGYRFWFVNKGGFHFGLCAGTNISFDKDGLFYSGLASDSLDESIDYEISSGLKTEFYLGVVFNFGDRSIEKYNK
jgi:hypothetical protein